MSGEPTLGQKAAIELLGTFMLTFVGASAIIATGGSQLLLIALAHGLALAVAVSMAIGISGGHINPAITIGLFVTKKISAPHALVYIIAQVTGAVIAGAIVVLVYPHAVSSGVHYGALSLASDISVVQGIAIEAVITFILMLSVFGTVVDSRSHKLGGFGVGLTLAVLIMAAGPFTGAAANPARAIGPEIASAYFANWYVYWIGPIIGAVLGALAYEYAVLRNRR